jgi:hypothetical protein
MVTSLCWRSETEDADECREDDQHDRQDDAGTIALPGASAVLSAHSFLAARCDAVGFDIAGSCCVVERAN